jgi:coproporphyrinogen III oxidase-like Fe-S oxidoreductase
MAPLRDRTVARQHESGDVEACEWRIRDSVVSDDVGVYVHVPFCERICPYCDFAVVRAPALARDREDAFVAALLAELARRLPAVGPARLPSR